MVTDWTLTQAIKAFLKNMDSSIGSLNTFEIRLSNIYNRKRNKRQCNQRRTIKGKAIVNNYWQAKVCYTSLQNLNDFFRLSLTTTIPNLNQNNTRNSPLKRTRIYENINSKTYLAHSTDIYCRRKYGIGHIKKRKSIIIGSTNSIEGITSNIICYCSVKESFNAVYFQNLIFCFL